MNKVKIEIEYNANGLPILERLGNPYLSFRLVPCFRISVPSSILNIMQSFA